MLSELIGIIIGGAIAYWGLPLIFDGETHPPFDKVVDWYWKRKNPYKKPPVWKYVPPHVHNAQNNAPSDSEGRS